MPEQQPLYRGFSCLFRGLVKIAPHFRSFIFSAQSYPGASVRLVQYFPARHLAGGIPISLPVAYNKMFTLLSYPSQLSSSLKKQMLLAFIAEAQAKPCIYVHSPLISLLYNIHHAHENRQL